MTMNTFTISGRQLNHQNLDNALNFWQFYLHKAYGGGRIESFFNSMKARSRLYGGRPCPESYSFSDQHAQALNQRGIGITLTLSNHYFNEQAYEETRPILEKLDNSINSLVIANDELATNIARDFTQIRRKASVIKLINTVDDIHKALELYHSVVLHPSLNDDAEFLQSIDCKNQIVLFANSRCLYQCENPICYKYISKQMITDGKWDKTVCHYKDNREEVGGYTVFDLGKPHFDGFTSYKLIPVPDSHLQMDYQQVDQKASLMPTRTGIAMVR